MTANSAALPRTLFLADAVFVIRGLDSEGIDLPATDLPFCKGERIRGNHQGLGVTVEYKDVWRRGGRWRGGMDAERHEKEPRGSTPEAMTTGSHSETAAIGP